MFRNYGAPISGCVDKLSQIAEPGGKVALGNDYGGWPGAFELGIPMYEIQMLSQAGMRPMQITEASTKTAAQVIGMDDELDMLEPGKIADVPVVGGDPLDDLQASADVKLVIHDGVVIRAGIRG